MPIYCYKCESCKAEIEIEQKINDPPPYCEKCCVSEGFIQALREKGSSQEVIDAALSTRVPMVRQISITSFILQGGGWFKDGYSKKTGNKNNVS